MWAPQTAPRLLSLQVQQGSCRAQENSPSTGVSISAGITVLGSNQLGSGGWPCITPSLASTSVALEEPSGNRIAARESGWWGEAKVELWHGLFSMIHVGSSMPCHKAQWEHNSHQCPPLVFRVPKFAPSSSGGTTCASKTCVGGRLLVQALKAVQ